MQWRSWTPMSVPGATAKFDIAGGLPSAI